MKKYIKPKIEFMAILADDIISTSVSDGDLHGEDPYEPLGTTL